MNTCFLDFETTGIDVFKDNPLEIGCVLVNENGVVIKKYHSLIYPRNFRKFSKASMHIHGLDKSFLEGAKSQHDVLSEFFSIMGTNYRFAGWNINFDVTFFRRMCHLNSFMREYNKIYHRHIDVQSIVFYLKEKNVLPKDLNSLDDLIRYFNLSRSKKHNAIEDAELTNEILKKILELK